MKWTGALASKARDMLSGKQAPAPPPAMSGPTLYYTKTLVDHFTDPRHVGEMTEEEADGYALHAAISGGHHEGERRAGTENVAGIAGLAAALEAAVAELDSEAARIGRLRDRLERGATEQIPEVFAHGAEAPRVPNTSNLSFASVDGESVILHLDLRGICAATGSACTTEEPEPSHVLLAMGVEPRLAQGAVRFSLGHDNTEEDVDLTVDALVEIIPRLRAISSCA